MTASLFLDEGGRGSFLYFKALKKNKVKTKGIEIIYPREVCHIRDSGHIATALTERENGIYQDYIRGSVSSLWLRLKRGGEMVTGYCFSVYSQINLHPCIIFKYYFGNYKFSFVLSG